MVVLVVVVVVMVMVAVVVVVVVAVLVVMLVNLAEHRATRVHPLWQPSFDRSATTSSTGQP